MSAKQRAIELPATISQVIYDHLRRAILHGELKPGQRVQEKEVAVLFQVSSTPVREAFFRLAAEKFLTITARKEVLVQGTSDDEVKELYEVVRALDGHAILKVVGKLTVADLEKLRLMTARLGEHFGNRDPQRYLEQNLRIHERLWQACRNRYLYETLSQMMEKISIHWKNNSTVPFADPAAMEKSYRDHVRIQEGLERRDLDVLERIIKTHWGEEFIKPSGAPQAPPSVSA